jgi:hypothetical protein
MASKIDLLHLTLCGPGDVQKEIDIAREVITNWNTQHGDGLGLYVKHQHWKTDAYPDASERGQGVINRQLIDTSDILICIFWSRFGSPTGVADSGTEEEIRRGMALGKYVAIYFSQLDPLPPEAKASQIALLENFKTEILPKSLSWGFRSREEFKNLFTNHIAKIVHGIRSKPPVSESKKKTIKRNPKVAQTMTGGTGNVQVGGNVANLNHYAAPPKIKVVLERPEGCITSSEAKQIQEWIEALAEATTDKTRPDAFKQWWVRLKNKFDVAKYDAILSEDMPSVREWYRQQMGILTRKLKRKAPSQWQNARMGSIKAAMKSMGRTNADYYPELALRLKMPAFDSLTQLTKTNLDRVYSRVMEDKRKGA